MARNLSIFCRDAVIAHSFARAFRQGVAATETECALLLLAGKEKLSAAP